LSSELPFSTAARQWQVFKVVGRSVVISNVPLSRMCRSSECRSFKGLLYVLHGLSFSHFISNVCTFIKKNYMLNIVFPAFHIAYINVFHSVLMLFILFAIAGIVYFAAFQQTFQ
jgi:hypothetical protein